MMMKKLLDAALVIALGLAGEAGAAGDAGAFREGDVAAVRYVPRVGNERTLVPVDLVSTATMRPAAKALLDEMRKRIERSMRKEGDGDVAPVVASCGIFVQQLELSDPVVRMDCWSLDLEQQFFEFNAADEAWKQLLHFSRRHMVAQYRRQMQERSRTAPMPIIKEPPRNSARS